MSTRNNESHADGFDKRIRELEARSPVTTPVANLALTLVDLTGRIHALECGEKELYARCQEVAGAALAALQDRERQDRWHATYNAALQANAVGGVEARHINAVHESCEAAADRAHGPLEIVVPAGTTFDEAALAKGGKFVSQPGWSQWDAKVEALVKAAGCVKKTYEDRGNDFWIKDVEAAIGDMAAALKPFETEHGE